MHEDTISNACKIFDGIQELITKYKITESCKKCNPVGIIKENK